MVLRLAMCLHPILVWATRILEDTREEVVDFSADIGAQNAAKEMHGKKTSGEFRILPIVPVYRTQQQLYRTFSNRCTADHGAHDCS